MPSDKSGFSRPAWRLQNLYSIVDKNARKVRFTPNVVQSQLNESVLNRKKILKARQMGITTNELIKQLDFTIWNQNVTSCILAHEQDTIEKLFNIVRRAYEFLDPRLRPELDRGGGSKYELRFPTLKSKIYCDLESRGDTIQWLHVSEAAFMDPDRLKATLQTVPLTGRVTIETTPNGMGNHFYESWNAKHDGYERFFFPWYFMPEYAIDSPPFELNEDEEKLVAHAKRLYGIDLTPTQIAFRRFKKSELKSQFIQEYPEDDQSCFLASGSAALDLQIVKEFLDRAPEPIEKTDHLRVYESAHTEGIYIIGADCAEGSGGDYSVGVVIEAKSMLQVAVLRGRFKPSDFAEKLVELCRRYSVRMSTPLLAVERNNHGHAVLQWLYETLRYSNLYRAKDEKLGWLTDRVTRPLMIDTFIDAVEHRHLTLLDTNTIWECMALVEEKGKIEAAGGKHDDCVIATAIALHLAVNQNRSIHIWENIGERILVG